MFLASASIGVLFLAASAFAVKNGALVSTQLYYLGKQDGYSFNIVSTDVESSLSTIIQELLPGGPDAARSFESFTAYNADTRDLYVVATDFPSVAKCTFWKSTISSNTNATTPLITQVEIEYPVSRSPWPLNYAHLVLSRILVGPAGKLYATFLNGEVHAVDLEAKTFTHLYKLISDEQQLTEIHPYMTWGHVFDAEKKVMWSVAMGASDAFLMSSDLETHTMSSWVTMSMPEGDNSGFSPETIVNMHMAKVDEGPTRLMTVMESLDNLGFDQVSFLDTTTGKLDCVLCNMMSLGIVLQCDTNINGCDKWRVSAWDPVNKSLYYQGHSSAIDETNGDLLLAKLTFDDNKATGNLNWYTNINTVNPWFGLSGFQFVPFV